MSSPLLDRWSQLATANTLRMPKLQRGPCLIQPRRLEHDEWCQHDHVGVAFTEVFDGTRRLFGLTDPAR